MADLHLLKTIKFITEFSILERRAAAVTPSASSPQLPTSHINGIVAAPDEEEESTHHEPLLINGEPAGDIESSNESIDAIQRAPEGNDSDEVLLITNNSLLGTCFAFFLSF